MRDSGYNLKRMFVVFDRVTYAIFLLTIIDKRLNGDLESDFFLV